jgi:hypothetical protein
LTPKEVTALKKGFPRQGFVKEIEALEAEAKSFAAELSGKGATLPSQAWKLLMSAKPEAVLAVAFSTKNASLQAKLKSFFTEWPQARQKMPYALMQEMRITPELPVYEELLERLFFELMDGNLTTPEEMKAFLEPYSPPAPPPPVSMRRLRASKKEAKPAKSRSKKPKAVEGEGAALIETGDKVEIEAPGPAALVKAPAAKAAPVKAALSKPAPVPVSVAKKAAPPKVTQVAARKVVPAKKVVAAAKKAVPVKKTAPVKKAVALKKVAPGKKSVPAKRVAAKKSVPAKKLAAKKALPVKKATPSKKVAAKKAAPAKAVKRR